VMFQMTVQPLFFYKAKPAESVTKASLKQL
jgi:hypothetical protein